MSAGALRDSTMEAGRTGTRLSPIPRVLYWAGIGLLGFHNLRLAPAWALSDIAFAASAGLLILIAPDTGATYKPKLPMAVICGSAVFATGGLLTAAVVPAGQSTLLVVLRFLYLTVIWFSLGMFVLRSLTDLLTTVTIWVASAGLSGVAAVAQLFGLTKGIILPGTSDVQFFGRMTGFTDHPNSLGSLCAVAFAPALMLSTRRATSWRGRLASWLALAGILSGLVLSGSVSGLAAAFAGAITWLVLVRPNWRTLAGGGLMVLFVLAVIDVQQSSTGLSPMGRILSVTGLDNMSPGVATGLFRLDLIGQALNVISASPLVGVGLDPVSAAAPFSGGFGVHNILLFAWVGGGIFAFVGMVIILGAVATLCYRTVVPRGEGLAFDLGSALAGGYVAFIVYTMSAPVITDRYLWIPAPLILVLSAIRKGAARRERASLA